MLTEETIIDQISVDESNNVSIRQATIIKKDGVEISKQYHRVVLHPGDDVSSYDVKVQSICSLLWV